MRSISRPAALLLVMVAVLAGCASLLGDFAAGGGDGGSAPGSDGGSPLADTGAGADVQAAAGPDASDAGGGGQDAGIGTDSSTGGDSGSGPEAGSDTGAGDAGVDQSAPWSPALLDQAGKLAFWLEASSANLVVSGGAVDVWNDLSQNKNDASNSNGGPTLATAAINGHNALNFASSDLALAMTDATSLQFGVDQIYITAVAQVTSGSPYFFAKYTATGSGFGEVYSTGILFFATSQTTDAGAAILGPVAEVNSQAGDGISWDGTGFEDGSFHIVAVRRTSSSSIVLTMDDQASETADTGLFDVSASGEDALIGAVQFGNIHPATSFDLAEVLAVHSSTGVVADADVASVHAYLKQKYGL